METNLDYASIKKMFRKAKENLPKVSTQIRAQF